MEEEEGHSVPSSLNGLAETRPPRRMSDFRFGSSIEVFVITFDSEAKPQLRTIPFAVEYREPRRRLQMKRLSALLALCAGSLCAHAQLEAPTEKGSGKDLTGSAIVNGLKTKQGEELHRFISFLDSLDKSQLTNEEIDPIIEQLLIIQESDPYQVARSLKGSTVPNKLHFVNRSFAGQCIFRFKFQKLANALRQLPLDQRVARIIDGIEHPPKGFEFDTGSSFEHELSRTGRDAVPFIIRHKPSDPSPRRAIVQALAAIGDPRGIDYIIEVLSTPGDQFRLERPLAARDLAKFDDPRVIKALVEALQDETHEEIDRHLPQRADASGHRPYIGRYLSVQHAAAESLTKLTGKDWGLFFDEDYRTWSTWLGSGQPEAFVPSMVTRSDQEIAKLVGSMFHRYMSARPNPWQPQNSLGSEDGIRSLATDLKQLGPRAVPLIANEYRARIKETPIWHEELRNWTSEILQALDANAEVIR